MNQKLNRIHVNMVMNISKTIELDFSTKCVLIFNLKRLWEFLSLLSNANIKKQINYFKKTTQISV